MLGTEQDSDKSIPMLQRDNAGSVEEKLALTDDNGGVVSGEADNLPAVGA